MRQVDDTFFCWFGEAATPPLGPGGIFTSVIEIFAADSSGCWNRTTSRHVQRHHPPEVVERLLKDAGFELVQCCGQVTGGRLEAVADESVHMKVDYFARLLPSVAGPVRGG